MEWILFVLLSFDARAETHVIEGFTTKEKCMRAGREIGEEIKGAWMSLDKSSGGKMAGKEQKIIVNCKVIEK